MNYIIKFICKSILIVICIILFNYRYIRLFSGFSQISNFVYGTLLILLILATIKMLRYKHVFRGFIAWIPPFYFFGLFSWVCVILRYGFNSQIQYFFEGIAFIPIFFYFDGKNKIEYFFKRILILHTLVSGILLLLEFYLVNYLDIHLLSQHSLWAETRFGELDAPTESGYSEDYPFIGIHQRPWGFLAQPQSTGVYYAGAALFTLTLYLSKVSILKKSVYLTTFVIALLALFFSGSKTGYVIFLIQCIYFLNKSIKNILAKAASYTIGIIGLTVYVLDKVILGLGGPSEGGWIMTVQLGLWNFENYRLLWLFGDGINHAQSQALRNDFYIYNLLINYGPILFFIFSGFIYSLIKFAGNRANSYNKQYIYLIISLLLGCLHYDSLTRFPLNLIFIVIIAMLNTNYNNEILSSNKCI